jgi:dihydroflavonol-4-reductase
MMKRVLTGGTGLLGSHFAELATTEGAVVVSLVRPNSNTAYLNDLGITLATGNLQDVASLASGMKGCDIVVHAASPIGGWGKPGRYEEDTVGGTRNVVTAMEASSVRTLIHISPSASMGLIPSRADPSAKGVGLAAIFCPMITMARQK